MAKLPSNFRADEHDEKMDFPALPAGEYQARIKSSEMIENSKKTGSYVKFIFEIIEEKFGGRLLFANLNLVHTNPTAVEIAEQDLAAICRACGKVSIDDTDELHGEELILKITVRAATSAFAESNDIKNYKAIPGIARPNTKASAGIPEKKKTRRVSFDD